MLKNATHKGEIVSQGQAREVWLRETPKSWTDGRCRWKKFDYRGEPITDPVCFPRYGRLSDRGTTLVTATIRRLTVSDRREPLAQAVVQAEQAHRRAIDARNEAAKRATEAGEIYGKASRALKRYDRKHGTGPEPEIVDSDGNAVPADRAHGSGKAAQ